MPETETVTIPKSEYDRLRKAELKLDCLICEGVDNWQGYSDAMRLYHAEIDEDKHWSE